MPCPFGYTGENSDAEASSEEEVQRGSANSLNTGNNTTEKKPKSSRFDFDKNPVDWFYKSQIKAEEEYQAKRKKLAKQTRARMESIMSAKAKVLEFDDDIDELSGCDTELSELDSDVHSVGSIRSCAESWILESEYKKPAQAWIMTGLQGSVATAAFAVYCAYSAQLATKEMPALNTKWMDVVMALSAALLVDAILLFVAARKRSKRILLMSQGALVLLHTVASMFTTLMIVDPVSPDMTALGTCSRTESCKTMPSVGTFIEAASWLPWSCGTIALVALGLTAVSLWYTFELAFVDKKAAKHTRRHRHNKHHIPWHKIKVVGPTMSCGEGGPKPAGSTGKCPIMH